MEISTNGKKIDMQFITAYFNWFYFNFKINVKCTAAVMTHTCTDNFKSPIQIISGEQMLIINNS